MDTLDVLSKLYILQKYNQLDIFAKYLTNLDTSNIQVINPISKADIIDCVESNGCIKSPLRVDMQPSVGFKYDNNPGRENFKTDYYTYGKLRMRDFTMNRYNKTERFWGDCFDLVEYILTNQLRTEITFQTILEHIESVFQNNIEIKFNVPNLKQATMRKVIEIKVRQWNIQDKEIWSKPKLSSEILNEHCVYPVQYAWINRGIKNRISYQYSHSDPCYAYYSGNDENNIALITLYFPERTKKDKKDKKPRFMTNHSKFQGIDQLQACKTLLITKSLKDVMVIKSVISLSLQGQNNKHGVIGVPGEGYRFELIDLISLNLKYGVEEFIFLYDNDMVGKRNLIRIKQKFKEMKNVRILIIPMHYKCKDAAEFNEIYGVAESYKLLKQLEII